MNQNTILSNNEKTSPFLQTVEDAEQSVFPPEIMTLLIGARSRNADASLAHYKRVAAEPSHAGKFRSSDGSWWELCNSFVTPEMVCTTPVGYRIGEHDYSSAHDDTRALQDCMQVALTLGIPMHLYGKWYRHNSTLFAEPLTGINYPNTHPDPDTITFWSTINAPQLTMIGFGNTGLVAGSPMNHQLKITAPPSLGSGAQPQWCRFENIKFDGAHNVAGSNLFLEWSGNAHILNCGFSRAGTGITISGYGVFLVQHCDIGGRYFCIDVQRGGDATISDCDIFVESVGANIAGNIKFNRNILTGTGFGTIQNKRIGLLISPVGQKDGEDFPYSYGVRIDGNEFFALDAAIYGDASSMGFDAINQISVTNNHVLGDPTTNTDMTLANLNSARNVYIAGNQINRDVAALSSTSSLYLTDCNTIHVVDNDFSNIAQSVIMVQGCTNISIHHNTLTNCGCISNYLLHSEDFSNTIWKPSNLALDTSSVMVPTGSLLCPNGARLSLLTDTATMGVHSISQQMSTHIGQPYTLSVIVAASTLDNVMLCPYQQGMGCQFNLSNGTMTAQSQGYSGGITPLHNGYYRLWCTLLSAPETNAVPGLYLLNQEKMLTYSGLGQGVFAGAFMWTAGEVACNYPGPTLASPMGNEAPIVITDSFQCVVESCQLLQKYNQTLPLYLVAETGASNYNGVYRNNIPDNVIPFYQKGSSSFFESWVRSTFRSVSTEAQLIKSSSTEQLAFAVILSNRGNKFSGSTFSPGQGQTSITASISLTGATAGATISLSIYKNGKSLSSTRRPAIARDDGLSVTIDDESQYGDYYQVFFYNGGSTPITISDDNTLTYFNGKCC